MIHNKSKGFTLVELMVVVSIILTLGTVSLFTYSKSRDQSKVNSAKADIARMMVDYETYKASHFTLSLSVTGKTAGVASDDADLTNWNNFWTAVYGVDSYPRPTPPTGSGIVYTAKTNASGTYRFCASGGPIQAIVGSANWVGENGYATGQASCDNF